MSYENKFVQDTLDEEGKPRVAFRLKQAKYSSQKGDVLFLSPYYNDAVLEGKKLKAQKNKEPDSSYNSFYFNKHCKEQYEVTKEFAQSAGLQFLYFFYVTFGRGNPAEFNIFPAARLEERVELDDTVAISLQEMRWWTLDNPWFEQI